MMYFGRARYKYPFCTVFLLFALSACGTGLDIPIESPAASSDEMLPLVLSDGPDGIAGSASIPADCEGKLPCVWSSRDSGVIFTVKAVTTDTSSDQLEIAYTVQTTRDTVLELTGASTAVDSSAQRYTGSPPSLGASNGSTNLNNAIDLLAGTQLTVTQAFRESPAQSTRSIARFSLGFFEAGISHTVEFLSLPLDSESGLEIDCLSRLPCSWLSNNEEYSVNIFLAEGLVSGRLSVRFELQAFVDLTVSFDPGSAAIGNEGTTFRPKIHSLGDQSSHLSFESTVVEDSSISGSQTYFRTANLTATRLKKLSLKLAQIDAPGAGFPVFTNVPLN